MSDDELETPWCPCQEERLEERYPDCPRRDWPYLDGGDALDYLQRVKPHTYYEQKREQARREAPPFATNCGPKTPRTRRGKKIIKENFPDADFVCPCCEKEFEEIVTIREI